MIDAAQRPLLMAGQGVMLGNAEQELQAFLAKSDIPVASSARSPRCPASIGPPDTKTVGMSSRMAATQFTLLGDVRKGRRPSFIAAGDPKRAEIIYEAAVERLRGSGLKVATGKFGANMQVSSVNDGPVTILLDSTKLF